MFEKYVGPTGSASSTLPKIDFILEIMTIGLVQFLV